MKLITLLSRTDVATKSYHLFHTVMHTPVPLGGWEASRLALHGAYKGELLPLVDDPQDILTFLNHHFELALQGNDQDGPIQNALRALAHATNPTAIDAPRHFDQPSFVRGIHFAFKADRPKKLREAALFLLPLIGDKWFDAAHQIIPNVADHFCRDWNTIVGSIEHTSDAKKAILTTLFYMMDSPHWRPHIPEGKWKLLEYYSLVPDDCRPLKRCLENHQLVVAISQMRDPEAIALWPRILWLEYDKLTPQVQEALKRLTKAAKGRKHIDEYHQEVMKSLRVAELMMSKLVEWSGDDPDAIALNRKIESHRKAIGVLEAIRSQP